MRPSQRNSKPQRQGTEQHRPASPCAERSHSTITLAPGPTITTTIAPAVRKTRLYRIPATATPTARRARRRASNTRVRQPRTLRAAGVVRTAAVGALGVGGAAVGDALGAPFLADEEGQGLAVLGEVGGEAVRADAGVGQVAGGAVVAVGGAGRGLEADAVGSGRC